MNGQDQNTVRPTSPLDRLVRRLQLLEPGDMLTCADYDALGDAIDEIERLRKDLDDSDAAACLLAEQAADQCIRAEKAEADVARLREALQYARNGFELAYSAAERGLNDEVLLHCGHHGAKADNALLTPNTGIERLDGRKGTT